MKKKLAITVLGAILISILCLSPVLAAAKEFPDVTTNDYRATTTTYRAIYWGVDRGLINGFSDGTFRPLDSCTRAQFAIMVWKLAGRPAVALSSLLPFSDIGDVTENNRKAIVWLSRNGIINGYGDGTFGTYDNVLRHQVMIMLWKLAGRPEVSIPSVLPFNDMNSVTENTKKAIIWGSNLGIIKGYGDGRFGTYDNCTRAQWDEQVVDYYKCSGCGATY